MKVKQEGQELRFVQMMFLFLMFAMFTGIVSATDLTVNNADFEAGSAWNVADDWIEPAYNVYYATNSGGEYDTDTIQGRAATFYSTGSAAIYQALTRGTTTVYADSYDVYTITFDVGYRNDLAETEGDICNLQVALKQRNTNNTFTVVADENIRIGEPVKSNVLPSVGTVMTRTVVLKFDRKAQDHLPLNIWFTNTDTTENPSQADNVVIDNISVKGYKTVASWQFEDPNITEDTAGSHDLDNIPGKAVRVVEGSYLYIRENWDNYGLFTPNSSDFNLNNFTVSAWVKMPLWALNLGDTRAVLCYRNLGDKRSGSFLYCNASDVWRLQLGSSAGSISFGNIPVVQDEWTQLTFRVHKTGDYGSNESLVTAKLHVNGNTDSNNQAENVPYKSEVPNSSFCIGFSSPTYGDYFSGYIDNVQYVNRYLANVEIADSFIEQRQKLYTPIIGATFRVMTYNIHSLSLHPSESLDDAVSIIELQDPDVLCLQEANESNVNELGNELGYPENGNGKIYRTWVKCNSERNYGNAIISYTPLYVINNYELPSNSSVDLNQTRKMTVAHTIIKGKAYAIANMHFTSSCNQEIHDDCNDTTFEIRENLRTSQAKEVIEILTWCKTPLILTGDLNNTNDGNAVDFVKQMFKDSFYYENAEKITGDPAPDPNRTKVDHIMVSQNTFKDEVTRTKRITTDPATAASDHYPVITTFTVRSEE